MKPDFVVALRKKIGKERLQLTSVSGVAFNQAGEVLLQLRSDTNTWAVVSGVMEPDEQPSETLKREFLEETSVAIDILGLASIHVEPVQIYSNGDIAQFLNITFLVKLLNEPKVNDRESLKVGWHSMSDPPKLSAQNMRRINDGLNFKGTTIFMNTIEDHI
jgi:8-oxo-dGTP pyrophosphatase MutT (NUDIX family)